MPRLLRALGVALVAFTVAALVVLGGVAGWLYWGRMQTHAAEVTAAELVPLAEQNVPEVLTFDYQNVERRMIEAQPLLTPDFRQEFEQRANTEIIPQARAGEVVSQAHTVGVGVLEAERNSGTVLVFLNSAITDKSKQTVHRGSRLKVRFEKLDGKWLIDSINPI